MRIRIDKLFGLGTLEDDGREGRRKFGVPPGGAFDQESFDLANELLNNEPGSPAIEFSLGTLEFTPLDQGVVAIVGAATSITVNRDSVAGNSRFSVSTGDSVVINPPTSGLRTYIALPGGIRSPLVLNSVSGTRVISGQHHASEADLEGLPPVTIERPFSLRSRPIQIVLSPQFSEINGTFQVTRHIDRVGVRLSSSIPIDAAKSERSEPSTFGVVQVTDDGNLIIHGPDGPTIGGYQKLGCIVSSDLSRIGQLAPGDSVKFLKIN